MDKEYYGIKIIKFAPQRPREALEDDPAVNYIAAHMRSADKAEMEAQSLDPKEELISSVGTSLECYLAQTDKGIPVCFFGIALTAIGFSIWMLAGVDVKDCHKALVKCGMEYIREKVQDLGEVYNFIHVRNTRALRFIRRAGAEFGPEVTLENGETFTKFVIRKKE